MPIPTDNDVAAFIAEIKKWFNPIVDNNRPKISKWKWNFYELTTPDTYRLISTALYTNNMSIVSDKNIKLTIFLVSLAMYKILSKKKIQLNCKYLNS